MAKFGFNEADNYGNSSSEFFSLKDDKDTAQVRIMYNSVEDAQGIAVHQVQVGQGQRYVSCLRSYNDPVDMCPLCEAGFKVMAKLYVPLYDIDSGTVKMWERGKSFFSKLSSLSSRYNNLVGRVAEIERNGKKGDTGTTYEIYMGDDDGTTLEDLPEIPDALGTIVLDKTADEMQEFLETGSFGDVNTTQTNNAPVNRGANNGNYRSDRDTSARGGYNRGASNNANVRPRNGSGRPNF